VLPGEVQTKIVNGKFEDRIVLIVQRSEAELQRRRQQTEEHKAYRAELYKRYSLKERLEDLTL
jgi:ketol-acid reductoisomerase